MFNPFVSLYQSANKPVKKSGEKYIHCPSADIHFLSVLDKIQHDELLKKQVVHVRGELDKQKRDKLKKNVQAVTWSGTFKLRNLDADNIVNYTQIICIDIDSIHIDLLPHVKKAICKLPEVLACFLSTSGNGLKILFHVDTGLELHKKAFFSIGNYLEKQGFLINSDTVCQDYTRLCFLSHDADLYYNADAEIITTDFIEHHAPKKKETAAAPSQKTFVPGGFTPLADDVNEKIKKCHATVQKTVQAGRSTYNKYINLFAIQAIRWDISGNDCLSELLSYCGDHDQADTKGAVASVYRRFEAERGKYLQGINTPNPARRATTTKAANSPEAGQRSLFAGPDNAPVYDISVLFWYKTEKVDKKTGEIIGEEFKFSYDDAITFLENNGFYKYKLNNKFQLIYVDKQNNIIDIVDEDYIYDYFIGFLKTSDTLEYKRVRELFRRGAKTYCSLYQLKGLSYFYPIFKTDTHDTAYTYFRNGYYEIKADKYIFHHYSELDGFIWKKQIIDFDVTVVDFSGCDFELFLWYAITGRKSEINNYTDAEHNKMLSMRTSLGYLLHLYKDPALTKAVVSVDKQIRRNGEANGRTGKSLVSKALAEMIPMCMIDGPNFKFDYEFAFQKVDADTKLINFNDVNKNFDFGRLYGMITEEFTYNKKKIDSITMPFATSPKFYISTNHSLKGAGESDKGRQQIIEFSNYFSDSYKPAHEFGRMFLDKSGRSWDTLEWSKFYSFFIDCIRSFLQHGLIPFPLENYAKNKLLDTAGEDFVDWMEENVRFQVENNNTSKFDTGILFETYKAATPSRQNLVKNTFTKWVRMWADVEGFEINKHKNGERDRSSGRDYYTFTKNKASDPDGLELEHV